MKTEMEKRSEKPWESVTDRLPLHSETSVVLRAPAEAVFSHLDDHTRLSSHMSQSSWMMAGSRMAMELDGSKGQIVGARIRLSGRVLGVQLSVEEMITERNPPLRKVWETTGTPRLLVIGQYRMGYEITPRGDSSLLQVFIDYALPNTRPAHWLGHLLGNIYARWCTRRMAEDAARYLQ